MFENTILQYVELIINIYFVHFYRCFQLEFVALSTNPLLNGVKYFHFGRKYHIVILSVLYKCCHLTWKQLTSDIRTYFIFGDVSHTFEIVLESSLLLTFDIQTLSRDFLH